MDVAVAIPSKSNEIYQMIEDVINSLLSDVSPFHHDSLQTSREPLLFAVLECLSTWQGDYPFPHSALLSLCSSLLQFIHTLNDHCTSISPFPQFPIDMQARGSSHVDVSNRLSVLILIEARIFRTIRVEFLASPSGIVFLDQSGTDPAAPDVVIRPRQALHGPQRAAEPAHRVLLPAGGRLLLFPQRERLGVELRVAPHAHLLPGALAAGVRGDRGDANPRQSAAVDAGGDVEVRGGLVRTAGHRAHPRGLVESPALSPKSQRCGELRESVL